MGSEKPASTPELGPAGSADATPTLAGPGVGSLLRGARPGEKNVFAESTPSPSPVPLEEAAKKPLLPVWYFFAADVLLIAFALVIFSKSSSPLTGREAFLCIGAVVLAGIFGAMGVGLGRKRGS